MDLETKEVTEVEIRVQAKLNALKRKRKKEEDVVEAKKVGSSMMSEKSQ